MPNYDLTDKNISDTFQNVLQQTGSLNNENSLYDLKGNQIENLKIAGTITASIISASGTITAYAIKTRFPDVTSSFEGGITIGPTPSARVSSQGSASFGSHLTSSATLTVSGSISASGDIWKGTDKYILSSQTSSFGGGGAIDISGTPVNNQLAVWTDADTLEGESELIYNGDELIVDGDISASGNFNLESNKKLSWNSGSIGSVEISSSQGEIFVSGSGNAELFVNGNISGSLISTGSFGTLRLDYANLPTSDPGVIGAVWRSGTDLKISAG
jgi:hypothetical protein